MTIKLSRQVRLNRWRLVRLHLTLTLFSCTVQVGEVTVISGGGNITIKAASDLFMRLEVLEAAGGGQGVHIDANHSFNPDDDSEYTDKSVLQGTVNYQQTMSEWADPSVDTFQVDVADRFVPKMDASGNDGMVPLQLLLDAGGGSTRAGRVELLVGGWLDDILSGFSTPHENGSQAKRNPRKPGRDEACGSETDIDYFGPRNKA